MFSKENKIHVLAQKRNLEASGNPAIHKRRKITISDSEGSYFKCDIVDLSFK